MKMDDETRCRELLREAERTEKNLQEMLVRIRKIRMLASLCPDGFSAEDDAEIAKCTDLIRAEAGRIYSDFGADHFYGPEGRDPETECETEGVDGFFCDRGICFRCGILPVNLFRGTFENIRIRRNMYSAAIGKTAEKVLTENSCIVLLVDENYREKTFHFLFVYGSHDRNMIADSDNHYTRKVTNEIAFYLPNGDEGCSTDFRYSTIVTERIPSGTYITVTPGKASDIKDIEVIELWQEHIRGQNILRMRAEETKFA